MKYLISKKNQWSEHLFSILSLSDKFMWYTDDSYKDFLKKDNPSWIFFFHWSKIVPESIFENYKCVVVHTGNLPQDRGGSPIQNQILKNNIQSQVNLIKMEKQIDAGDIYLSSPITLYGSLTDIWMSIAEISAQLIKKCVLESPVPIKQLNSKNLFNRRKSEQSLINFKECDNIQDIHKFVQMLDADGYPKAYYDVENFRFYFSRSSLQADKSVLLDLRIEKIC